MEAFAAPSRRRTKSSRGFVDVTDMFANADTAPARKVHLRGE